MIDEFGPSDLSQVGADFDLAFQEEIEAPGSVTAQWVFGPGTSKSTNDGPRAIAAANPATYVDALAPRSFSSTEPTTGSCRPARRCSCNRRCVPRESSAFAIC